MRNYIKEIEKDEIRSNFLVTTDRKKIWQRSMEILTYFSTICERHKLRWYAAYGTLLGAVRHHGFIPWDDDIDIWMPRPDYEELKKIAAVEIGGPYEFQTPYTSGWLTNFAKIRDSRTTAIEFTERLDLNQGMFLDIFPLDTVFIERENNSTYQLLEELWLICSNPEAVQRERKNGHIFSLSERELTELLSMPMIQVFSMFESLLTELWGKSEYVNNIVFDFMNGFKKMARKSFHEFKNVEFEQGMIIIPKGYDEILISCYGDYHKHVRGTSAHNEILLSPDIPYTRYFQEVLQKGEEL